MASGLFIDPLVLLRATPLISSTCQLWFAWDQHFFLRIFNEQDTRGTSKTILPLYFESFFRNGLPSVLGMLAITIGTSTANLYIQPADLALRHSLGWYKMGALFAAGHLLYVPFIAPSVKALVEGDGDVNDTLDRWLWFNAVRGMTVDLAAWTTLGVAVAKTFGHSP